ncbi:hypothetical protein DV738_g5402, partial [Chaetothyriales sp. CBS 135597]
MDQLLRSRKANSATRKKRPEQALGGDRRIQHRRILYDDLFARPDMHMSDSTDWSQGTMGSAPTVTTLNAFATEDSVPKYRPRAVGPPARTSSNPRLRPMVPDAPLNYHNPATLGQSSSSPSPEILPSLVPPADWKYDRFSVVMSEFTLPTPASSSSHPTFSSHVDESVYDDSSVPDLEYDEDVDADDSSGESLVETAQPVSYHLPKVRPSVISIGSRASSKEWKTLPSERDFITSSPGSGPPTRLQRRESTSSTHSGFQACEAQLMEVPDRPDSSLYMMSNTSSDSFAMSQARQWSPGLQPNTIRKHGHRRINSFKSFIKSPVISRSPSLQVPHQHQHQQSGMVRPSTAVADFLDDDYNPFETVPADLNTPPVRASWNSRQESTLSYSYSTSTNASRASPPMSPFPSAEATAPDTTTEPQSLTMRARRKSMRALRKRGESIGQAFKMAAIMARGGSKADDLALSPPPPVPVLPSQHLSFPWSNEDFEARISRQSPASTASEDDDNEDYDDDNEYDHLSIALSTRNDTHEGGQSGLPGAAGPPSSPVAAPLQRIRSMPLSSSSPPSSPPQPLLSKSSSNGSGNGHISQTQLQASHSDVETPLDTEAAVAQSARRAHPLPPTSPKVPTYEYYGFVLYLASSLAFLIYILWSYLPSPFLHALGITYYPNRWWSLAIPAWIVMLLVYIYVALLAYNVEYLTLPLNSSECMVDEAGNVAILDSSGRIRKGGSARFIWNEGTDAVMDVPIGGVCEVLYGDG